jgi:hypothetical protein
MKDLFVQPVKFEKTALSVNMNENANQWVEELITHFHEKFPRLANLPVNVNFQEKDESKGYATGALVINNQIALPVIINNFKLNPLDTAINNGIIVPFNESTVDLMFSNLSAFGELSKESITDDMTALFNNELETMVPREKQASILDIISSGITKEAQEEFLAEVRQYEDNFKANETWEVVEKIASLRPDSQKMTEELAKKLVPRDIYMIEKTGNFEFTVFLGNSNIDDVEKITVSREQVKKAHSFLEKSAAVKKYKQFKNPSELSKIAKIVNFDKSETGLVLNLDNDYNYRVREDVDKKYSSLENVKTAELEKEALGCFIIGKNVSKPFFIEKVSHVNDETRLEISDGFNIYNIRLNNLIKTASISEDENIDYYLPKNTKFIKLGNMKESMVDFSAITPGENFVLSTDGKTLSFDGPVFRKYAELGHPIENVSKTDGKWMMIQTGVHPEEIEKISVDKGDKYYFKSDLSAPVSLKSYVEKQTEKIAEELQKFEDNDLNLIKQAAGLMNKQTVESVLSLKFLNKKNILQYVEAIPLFEKVLSNLAQLLISSRLGLEVISEEATKEAMESLSKVTKSLYEISALIKNVKK